MDRRTCPLATTEPDHYLPGLDALRALAVAAVVLFHLDYSFIPGGFFGVSLFFTLSGFLITRNLLLEIDRTGTVSLRRFWARRARRLFPAAWFVLAALAGGAVLAPNVARGIGFRGGDALAALANVANWRFLSTGASYASLFQAPSSVLHFWSLAIEEQSYVIVALLVAGLTVGFRRRTPPILLVVSLCLAFVSWLVPIVMSTTVTRTYYGTDTRIGEILAGVALACGVDRLRRRGSTLIASRAWLTAGVLVGFVGLVNRTTASSPGLARGLLPLISLLSCVLIVSAVDSRSWLARAGSFRLVGGIGRISYVIYLVHWPLILYLKWKKVNLHGLATVAGILVGFVVVAWLIVRLVERPVRARRWPDATVAAAAVTAIALIVGAATWWRPPTSAAERTLANLERRAASIGLDSSKIAIAAPQTTATIAGTPAETTTNPTPPTSTTSQSGSTAITTPTTTSGAPATSSPTSVRTPPHPLIIRAFGDSILLSLVLTVPRDEGLVLVQAQHDMELGCGVTDFGGEQMQPECVDRIAHWTAQTVDPRPDAVVMMSCQWESVNRVLPGDRSSSHVGDSAFDVFVEASYVDALTQVFAWGAPTVLWTRCPYFSQTVGDDTEPESMQQSRQHERTDALNRLIELAVSQFPGRACTIPFDDWMNQHTNDARIRPDGSHYDFERAADAGEEFARKSLRTFEQCPPMRGCITHRMVGEWC